MDFQYFAYPEEFGAFQFLINILTSAQYLFLFLNTV